MKQINIAAIRVTRGSFWLSDASILRATNSLRFGPTSTYRKVIKEHLSFRFTRGKGSNERDKS